MVTVVATREKTGNWQLEARKTLYNLSPLNYLSF